MSAVSSTPQRQRLGLAPANTSYTDGSSGTSREVGVRFEDWTIDGTPLRELVGWARPSQEMTPLSREGFWPHVAVEHVRQLLGKAPGEFEDGRVPVLRCPVCADLGCSTLSLRLSFEEDAVIWSELGWQVNYEPFDEAERLACPSFLFERRAYEALLRQTLVRYSKLREQDRR